ncbi:uncharacterized protein N7459_009897 [Penicillium hispanicum]|uniref:uncharacterized protein n=1 Tax=Penicillium hispanicum TaxID=1080232 RepID=UPI0025404E42|nr:uncharacterized protein N7459_009897 [Penicillium hispanicum]KAJ5570467.1 hypothetical protein N7459_009897 [Penicillium hispanicum]
MRLSSPRRTMPFICDGLPSAIGRTLLGRRGIHADASALHTAVLDATASPIPHAQRTALSTSYLPFGPNWQAGGDARLSESDVSPPDAGAGPFWVARALTRPCPIIPTDSDRRCDAVWGKDVWSPVKTCVEIHLRWWRGKAGQCDAETGDVQAVAAALATGSPGGIMW